jgi:hypothetical protein
MENPNKTQKQSLEKLNSSDYHILIEQNQSVWNAKLEDTQSGEVLEFRRPIDLVRWLERRAKLENTDNGLA